MLLSATHGGRIQPRLHGSRPHDVMASAPGSNVAHFLFCGAGEPGSRYSNTRDILYPWRRTWPMTARVPVTFRARLGCAPNRRGGSPPVVVRCNNRSGAMPRYTTGHSHHRGRHGWGSTRTGKEARPEGAAKEATCALGRAAPTILPHPSAHGPHVSWLREPARHTGTPFNNTVGTWVRHAWRIVNALGTEARFHGNHFHNKKTFDDPLSLFKMAAIHLPIPNDDLRRRRNLSVETLAVRLDFRQEDRTPPESATWLECQLFFHVVRTSPPCW